MSAGRVLVPNQFVVELSGSDHARLQQYSEPLADELSAMVREHAAENAYSLLGPVEVRFEQADELDTGVFRVRSGVAAGTAAEETRIKVGGAGPSTQEAAPGAPEALPGKPRLVIAGTETHDKNSPEGRGMERAFFLTAPVTVLGRGEDADVQLPDGRVSRRHAEVRFEDGNYVIVDLGSTNGTLVNGVPVSRRQLLPSDRIGIGGMTLVFDQEPISS